MTPYEKARAAFDKYVGMNEPELPEHPMSRLQVQLHRFGNRFKSRNLKHTDVVLGQAEEFGEFCESTLLEVLQLGANAGRLCHVELKNCQGIRGMNDEEKVREASADAIGDQLVFLLQCCTTRRLDAWTLLSETAAFVEKRKREGEASGG